MPMEIKKPICAGCPHEFYYNELTPMRQHGVMMHMGERYCTGAKRARHFRKCDPKRYVPDWCPKRKSPCEMRVYQFKRTEDWILHEKLCQALGKDIPPEGRRYALAYELHTDLSPSEFAKRCDVVPCGDLIHVAVHLHNVVEIDDGISPVCFYKTGHGYQVVWSFDTATARKNVREDID
jgi:hypothetical protein